MSWAEVKKINSDLSTPLNELIDELSEEEVTLLNNIVSKLDNSTYGLSTLKTTLNSINTNVNELSEEEVTLINSIITKLDNTTYGLSAIKTMLNTVNTNAALLNNSTYGLDALRTEINANESLLKNSTYGLSAIKTLLSTVNTNAALLNNSTYGLSALKTAISNSSSSGGNNIVGALFVEGTNKTLATIIGSTEQRLKSTSTELGTFVPMLDGTVTITITVRNDNSEKGWFNTSGFSISDDYIPANNTKTYVSTTKVCYGQKYSFEVYINSSHTYNIYISNFIITANIETLSV